jgi:SAM-dependent methyltransferase
MDWTEGYESGVQYPVAFHREQSPAYLNFTCVLNGVEPVDTGKPFTYFELGFGRGLTVTLLAASNPQGDFYACDFNPAHVVGAQELAGSAGLANLTLLENSFAELAAGEVPGLPQFDFITMQGVYTWVNAENRAHIVEFIRRHLKPGGIVYTGYNAMPGWSVALPLQRMLLEYTGLNPKCPDAGVKEAIDFVAGMNDSGAKYFSVSMEIEARVATMQDSNAGYLVHEYLHRGWQPLYFADVARDFARAKLDYAGSCALPSAFPELCLAADKQALLDTISDPIVRETFRDYMFNTNFRKDVFVRGARRIPPIKEKEWLQRIGLALTVPRGKVCLNVKVPIGTVALDKQLYQPLLDALEARPHSLAELAVLPELKGQPTRVLWQAAALLTATERAAPYFTDDANHATDSAHKLNRALAARMRHAVDYEAFAAPLLGTGVEASPRERLMYLAAFGQAQEQEEDPRAIARLVMQAAVASGRELGANGKPYASEAECLNALTVDAKTLLTVTLPIWRQLKIV